MRRLRDSAPLCPAGHLPHKGEIGCRECFRQSSTLKNVALKSKLPISPLVGEMSGRTEGGAVE
ncbi:lytic murein transglycosylase [Mesorhizobium sp. B2-3-2]|nr:lytic murein transglycosylase [Mesorhizobium sp. B2-3-2]